MASKLFLKNDSKLALDFLRKSAFFTRPTQLAPPSTQTLNQKSQNPQHSAFSLAADFLGVHQKLFTGEEAFLSVRGSSLGEALWARGSGGSSSRGKIDREENIDDDEVDEFDDKDFVDEGMMDYEFDEEHHDDGDYWDSQDDDDDDVKDKKSRKKW